MPYSPQTWIDNNSSYPLSAARMNNIETGISNAATVADQGYRILTTAQRDALGSVTTGTIIYNTTEKQTQIYNGASWIETGDLDNPSGLSNTAYNTIRRLGYVQRTTNYNVSSTTLAGAADVFSSGITWTADGTSAYRVEFYCAYAQTSISAAANVQVNLTTAAGADLGRMGYVGNATGTTAVVATMHCVTYYTPAAGSTTINARAIYGTNTGALNAGAGGSGAIMPMWLAVFGPPLA